jgi:hypothetical protein
MTIFLCGQNDIAPDTCSECDGWLGAHPVVIDGMRYCSDDCVAYHSTWQSSAARDSHLQLRDLNCECEICAAAGRPTQAERDEWAQYLRDYGGVR